MEKIVAYLDLHGCLLRGARPNRILNRYDRKRERDGGQRPFCVPINHFSPPLYPNEPDRELLDQAVSRSSIHPAPFPGESTNRRESRANPSLNPNSRRRVNGG